MQSRAAAAAAAAAAVAAAVAAAAARSVATSLAAQITRVQSRTVTNATQSISPVLSSVLSQNLLSAPCCAYLQYCVANYFDNVFGTNVFGSALLKRSVQPDAEPVLILSIQEMEIANCIWFKRV